MSQGGVWEGLGGPIQKQRPNFEGIDPALDDCCRREAESHRQHSALLTTLRRHDVVAMAERQRRHLVSTPTFTGCRCCYDPSSDGGGEYRALLELRAQQTELTKDDPVLEPPTEEVDQHNSEEEEDSDDEFDYLLDEELPGTTDAMEERRAELELELLKNQIALQHGYGVHRQMHPLRVLKAAGLGSNMREPPPAVVLHLFDPDSEASASLDLCLEQLAEQYRGTVYLRSGGRSVLLMDADLAGKSLPRLNYESDLPALVAIRDGVVVNVSPQLQGLVQLHDNHVRKDAVETWLDRCGVLLDRPPVLEALCHIRPEEEALLDHLAAAPKVEEAPVYNCGVPECRKTFPHEHVGVQTEQQNGYVVPEEDIVPSVHE